ncbi:helix-turn-helix domain-containing protein [Nocardia asteroides]|uniref:helix-turn-helix domain-containing protein n=1 Tax=Nocardia asteroides TaxID=1824 RepID=UPI0037AD22C6
MHTFAELLVAGRSSAGLTQGELALRVGVSRQTVGRWEQGTSIPIRDRVSTIATALGIEPDALFVAAGHPSTLGPSGGVSQPVRPLLGSLPFHQLTPERFELACASILDHRHPGGHTARYGGSGETQYGIDLVTIIDGVRYATGQCKRHKTFGAAAIEQAVAAVDQPATINYLFLSREIATADARDEIENHPGWMLWDGESMSRYVRERMSDDDATRFVDTYFPNHREAFLGRALPGPWQTITEFYAAASGNQAFTHDWQLVGRDGEVSTLENAIRSDELPVSLLFGRGGIGKTRLLRSVAQMFDTEGWFVRLVGKDAEFDDRSYEAIPSAGAVLVVVDDAHDRHNCGEIVAKLTGRNNRAKILIACRPYGANELDRGLRQAGLLLSELRQVSLGDLSAAAAVELACAALGPDWQDYVDRLAALTRDCPLATTVGGYLIRSGQLDPTSLEQDDRIRDTILLGFTDALLARDDRERRQPVLEAVAMLQPFRSGDPVFQKAIAELVGTTYSRVSQQLRSLEDSGILLRRNESIRIVPDLLGDFVLADACFDRRSGVDSGYLSDVLAATGDAAKVHVFLNVSRVDWQVEHRMTDAVTQCWDFIRKELQHSDIATYVRILKVVNQVAAFQPIHAMALAQWVIEHPLEDEGTTSDAEWFQWTWQHVLSEVATTARLAAYRQETLRDACTLLWGLAQVTDHRSAQVYSNNPLKILNEISEFELQKPISVNQTILELAESWATHESGLSPLQPIEPLVATEGELWRYHDDAMTLTGFALNPEGVHAIRRRAIDLAVREILAVDLQRAIAGTRFIRVALRYPTGLVGRKVTAEERSGWDCDFLETIEKLREVLCSADLDPVVSLGVFEALSWHVHYGRGPVYAAASTVVGLLPDTLAYWFALWLYDGWGKLLRKPGIEFAESQRAMATGVARTAERAIAELDDEAITKLLEDRVQKQRTAFNRLVSPRGSLLEALVTLRPALATTLVDRILAAPHAGLEVFAVDLVDLVGRLRPTDLMTITRQLLDSTAPTVRVQAAIGLSVRTRGIEPLYDGELDLLHQFAVDRDTSVRRAVANAAFSLAATHHTHAAALLVSIPFSDAPDVEEEIFNGLDISEALTWDSLSPQQQTTIWTAIGELRDLDQYSIQHFLRQRSAADPAAVLNVLRQRIERAESNAAELPWRAVPTNWSEPLAVREHPGFVQQLNELLTWIGKGTSSLRANMGSRLFAAAAGGFDQPVLLLLQKTLENGNSADAQTVCLVLREAPSDLIFREISFVADTVAASALISPERLERVQDAFASCAVFGSRQGVPGEPFPEDVRLRDECAAIADQLAQTVPVAAGFYRRVSEHGAQAIRQHEQRDLDSRTW